MPRETGSASRGERAQLAVCSLAVLAPACCVLGWASAEREGRWGWSGMGARARRFQRSVGRVAEARRAASGGRAVAVLGAGMGGVLAVRGAQAILVYRGAREIARWLWWRGWKGARRCIRRSSAREPLTAATKQQWRQ